MINPARVTYQLYLPSKFAANHFMPLPPSWLKLHTKKVINAFLRELRIHNRWQTLYIISPWISSFEADAMSYRDFLQRITDFRTHVFVATRPPKHDWHIEALDGLKTTGRASVVLIDHLHTKLYCAQTPTAWIAMTGSANFTSKSMSNIEFAITLKNRGAGESLCLDLFRHATDIYRTSNRDVFCQATPFRP